jgi:hypothetical protein
LEQASQGHQGKWGVGSTQLPKVSGPSGSITHWSGMTLNYVSDKLLGGLSQERASLPGSCEERLGLRGLSVEQLT